MVITRASSAHNDLISADLFANDRALLTVDLKENDSFDIFQGKELIILENRNKVT